MNIKQLLTSSASPENISLFIKGLATLLVLLGADAVIVNQLNNDVMSLVTKVLEVVALGYSIWGAGRKIKLGRWSAPKYSDS